MKVNRNDIFIHKETGEVILITSSADLHDVILTDWFSFVNEEFMLTIGGRTIIAPCANKFPLISGKEIKKEYRKVGTLE